VVNKGAYDNAWYEKGFLPSISWAVFVWGITEWKWGDGCLGCMDREIFDLI
jgi:hypothetical protein